jgi:hypothetical protein
MNEPTGGKSTTTFNNVELWRERAKEMRLLAERVDEGPTRRAISSNCGGIRPLGRASRATQCLSKKD